MSVGLEGVKLVGQLMSFVPKMLQKTLVGQEAREQPKKQGFPGNLQHKIQECLKTPSTIVLSALYDISWALSLLLSHKNPGLEGIQTCGPEEMGCCGFCLPANL